MSSHFCPIRRIGTAGCCCVCKTESLSPRNHVNIAKSYLEAAGLPLGFNVVIFTLLNRLYLSNWIQRWKVLAPIPNYFCIVELVLLVHGRLGKNISPVSKAVLKLKFLLKWGNLLIKFPFCLILGPSFCRNTGNNNCLLFRVGFVLGYALFWN